MNRERQLRSARGMSSTRRGARAPVHTDPCLQPLSATSTPEAPRALINCQATQQNATKLAERPSTQTLNYRAFYPAYLASLDVTAGNGDLTGPPDIGASRAGRSPAHLPATVRSQLPYAPRARPLPFGRQAAYTSTMRSISRTCLRRSGPSTWAGARCARSGSKTTGAAH